MNEVTPTTDINLSTLLKVAGKNTPPVNYEVAQWDDICYYP